MFRETHKTYSKIETGQETDKESARFLLENWSKLTGAEENKNLKTENLTKEQLKTELYKELEPAIDRSIEALGINIPKNILEDIKNAKNDKEKSELQRKFIDSLAEQFNKIPDNKWSFMPKEIEKTKKINCSGTTLLMGHLLKKYGMEVYNGNPAGHSVNIVKLPNKTLWHTDINHSTAVKIEKAEPENIDDKTRMLKINQADIDYRLIIISPQEHAINSILGNFESLKRAVKNNEKMDLKEAQEFYNQNKDMLDKQNFQEISERLYPEINQDRKLKEFAQERERIEKLHEAYEELRSGTNKETIKIIEEEIKQNMELILEFLKNKNLTTDALNQLLPETKNYLIKLRGIEQSSK